MKHIKKFKESDSWVGSLYAYKNPEVKTYPDSFEVPLKQAYPYLCNKCNVEFFFMKEDGDPKCPNCKSGNCDSIN